MKYYYFNKNTDDKGKHEVHTKDCHHQPDPNNRTLIGYYSNCNEAIRQAKLDHPYEKFDGCYYCCNNCHKG